MPAIRHRIPLSRALGALLLCTLGHTLHAEPASLPLIPLPAQVQRGDGEFVPDARTALRTSRGDTAAERAAQALRDLLQRTRGVAPRLEHGKASAHDIAFATDATAPDGTEAYALDIAADGVRVRARHAAGLYYGAITLWQLLSTDDAKGLPRLPALHIEDAPRFAWRGLMLDTARHFRSVAEVKQFLDWMALHKFNTFHWHLTDDQGWRIEIKRYPKLTSVGAWRTPAGAAARDAQGRTQRYGGFYTQAQVREVVAYAAARHITVVPEIELPGHAQAAIAAYPQLGVTGRQPPVANGFGVSPFLYNVDEETFVFLQNVLDEVMALFPGAYLHIGGDEAAKTQWRSSPRVQARRVELGLADDAALQSWFVTRIGKYLEAHGRKLIGWDEILEGGLPPGAAVMSWRGTKGAVEAAHLGHDVVLSPGVPLYLDQKQSDAFDEPPGQPTTNTLRDVYAFEPIPQELDATQAHLVLGAQSNLWAEYMRSFEQVQHAAFPRATALAEVLWSPAASRDWNGFLARLVPQLQRYRQLDLHAADSAFAVNIALEKGGDASHAKATLSTQAQFGEIRYTTDGSEPTAQSPRYADALELPLAGALKAATFAGGVRLSATRTQALDAAALRTRRSEQLAFCDGQRGIRLEDDAPTDGVRAVLHTELGSVCLRWPAAPLAGAGAVRLRVGQVENAFMYGENGDGEPRPRSDMEHGVIKLYRGECGKGEVLASVPLLPALQDAGVSTLQAPLAPQDGDADVCLRVEGASRDWTWAVNEVQWLPAAAQ